MCNKNKVLAIIVAVLLFCTMLFSTVMAEESGILVRVQSLLVDNGIRVTIVYDVDTNVMYMISRGGGVCMLVDTEGNPRLYNGAN